MNAVSTKVLLLIFLQSAHLPHPYFLKSLQYYRYSENMDGANGQTGGKNRSSTFVLTAFISFGLFDIFPQQPLGSYK
jgi:hypothetical protein